MDIIKAIKNGDKRATAKLISMIENNENQAAEILKEVYQYSGNTKIIGITGAPGSGKSTLTNSLAKFLLKCHLKIGIIAVDPSSPISGGAFLGDRIRMSDLNSEHDVFIRSMGTRGALGGISKAVHGAIRVLEIFGMDYIFIETVGIGQSEIDIAGLADTVVLVTVPGMGDDIQAEKAGILEVSDIIVVNKSDHEDTHRTIQYLNSMLGLRSAASIEQSNKIEIISTIATTAYGIPELINAINAHQNSQTLNENAKITLKRRLRSELVNLIYSNFDKQFILFDEKTQAMNRSITKILKEKTNSYSEADLLLEEFIKWRFYNID